MKTTVLLLFAMFMLSSCNSEEAKTVNNAGTTSDSGTNSSGADISGIDVKGLLGARFHKAGVCTQQGGVYYRTHVIADVSNGNDFFLQVRYMTFNNSTDCGDNNNTVNNYQMQYRLNKAVIVENGRIELELTVVSHDSDPTIGNFDDYNSNLATLAIGQKDYWSIELDLARPDSNLVLPRGQDFMSPSTPTTPNEAVETFVTITYVAVA